MLVRVHYGPHVGTVIDFPFAVGRDIVAAGRGTRVAFDELLVATPTVQHRDPTPPARLGSPRRRDRVRP